MVDAEDARQRLREVARDPRAYVEGWRAQHPGGKVVGVLPMNFPREIARAAGVLPVIVQDDQQPVTEGRALLAEFYCGYTRNLADQAATGRFDIYDAVFMADHCIQLIGSADIVRAVTPQPVFFGMLISSLSDSWASNKIAEMMAEFKAELERFSGTTIADAALSESIAAYNRDRRLLRRLFDDRTSGDTSHTPTQLQDYVASSMVMDPVEHHDLLLAATSDVASRDRDDRVRVHLSGHLCHAPRRELLEVIEDSGALVVDDDLYTGRRHISTDVDESTPPLDAIGAWYAQRNVAIPCPTRVQHDANWDDYLIDATRSSGAEAVIHLMPKFCEPHMLFYPELRKRLDEAGIPQLLVETEHEGIPLEAFRTRLEALVELTLRKRLVHA